MMISNEQRTRGKPWPISLGKNDLPPPKLIIPQIPIYSSLAFRSEPGSCFVATSSTIIHYIMEGSLLIAFGFLSPWRRHYCILENGQFQFTQEKENPRVGSVSTQNAQIIVPIDSTTVFQIKSQGLTIQAKADNAQTRIKWVRALTAVPKKQSDPHGIVDQIYCVREQINSLVGQIIKKSNAATADKLKALLEVLNTKISELVTLSRKSKSSKQIAQNEEDLSFHSVLDPQQFEEEFGDGNQLVPEAEGNSNQNKLLLSYEPIKQKIIKENLVFQKIYSSFTKEANRIQLPTQSGEKNIDLINILKGVIGIDALNMELPITAYEPLSCLQKIAEEMMFEELLVEAHNTQDAAKRMLYVIAFALSAYSMSRPRLEYRAVLGQTYQLKTDRYRFIAEQVGPNQSAFHCESEQYIVQGFLEITIQFTGRSLEVIPKGYTHIFLKRHKQTISFNRCQKSIKNLVFGQATVVNAGELNFVNHQSQTGFLVLKPQSILFNDTNPNRVQGWVKSHGILRFLIEGSWSSFLTADDIKLKSKDKIWQGEDELFPQYYGFSNFTIDLNHLNLNEFPSLPGTDSRLRPDIRAHQYGLVEECERQRSRIQSKQKQRSKIYSPVWFEPSIHELTNTTFYRFGHKYWKQRNQKKWSMILDIF